MALSRWLKQRTPFQIRRKPLTALQEQARLLAGCDIRTIFDVGAHIGTVTQLYRQAFPDATVYAFEPGEEAFQQLAKAAGDSPKIKTQALALSDHEGTAVFHLNESSATSSLLPASGVGGKLVPSGALQPRRKVEIPVTTLDQFCAKNGVERIDILKMDIQGAELPALRGAGRLLREGRIGLIFTEVEFVPLYEQQGLYHHIAEFLEQHGFALHNFYDLNINREVGQLLWADAIFLSAKGEGRS